MRQKGKPEFVEASAIPKGGYGGATGKPPENKRGLPRAYRRGSGASGKPPKKGARLALFLT